MRDRGFTLAEMVVSLVLIGIVTASVGNVAKLDVDFLSVSAGAVNRDLLHRSHEAGKEVHVWTVNEPAQMNTMIHIGVDNIITDVPAVLVE